MLQMRAVLVSIGVVLCLTDFTSCELSPDLGPSGPTMETCDTYTCPENSTCVDDEGYIICMCKFGKVGENCDIDNPCEERKNNCPQGSVCFGDCPPNIICEGATGYTHCRGCVDGWTGMQCELKIDPCKAKVNPCSNDGRCIDTNEDVQCICKAGWVGKTCDCKQGSECDIGDIKEESGSTEDEGNYEPKTDTSKSGTESNLYCNAAVLIFSIILYINA